MFVLRKSMFYMAGHSMMTPVLHISSIKKHRREGCKNAKRWWTKSDKEGVCGQSITIRMLDISFVLEKNKYMYIYVYVDPSRDNFSFVSNFFSPHNKHIISIIYIPSLIETLCRSSKTFIDFHDIIFSSFHLSSK